MSFNHCITIPVTLIMIVDSLGRVHTGYFLRAANALQTSMSLLYYFFLLWPDRYLYLIIQIAVYMVPYRVMSKLFFKGVGTYCLRRGTESS